MNDSNAPQREEQALQILGRLQIACAQDSPASLMAAHMSLSCVGRLRSATEAGVVLVIPNAAGLTLEGAVVVVSYSVGPATICFQSDVVAVEPQDEGSIQVTLSVPETLQRENRRAAVRIPVPRGSAEATIIRGASRGPVQILDLSLLGMLIEVEPEQTPSLGDALVLRLVVGSMQVVLEAEVRRQDGRRFGLAFRTEGPPPKQMSKIMWRIQEERRLVHERG